MTVEVTFLGAGHKSVIATQLGTVVLRSQNPETVDEEVAQWAEQQNSKAGEPLFKIKRITSLQGAKPRKQVDRRQPDVLDKLGPKRTIADVVADKRRGTGLQQFS